MRQLVAYHWPGNVRELEHLVERSILLTKGNVIDKVNLRFTEQEQSLREGNGSRIKTIDEVERDHIITVVSKCKGKISGIGGAADLLKIPSTTLNSKMKRLNIRKTFIDNSL